MMMVPAKREPYRLTAATVTQLVMKLMLSTRPKVVNANVSFRKNRVKYSHPLQYSTYLYNMHGYIPSKMYISLHVAFCKKNCASIGDMGCDTCKPGFITEPECCQCEPGREEVAGVCSKYALIQL